MRAQYCRSPAPVPRAQRNVSEDAALPRRSGSMQVSGALLATGLAVIVATSGCYNAYGVRHDQLLKLDGYRAEQGKAVALTERSGHPITFDQDSRLYLYGPNGERAGGRFDWIKVQQGRLSGHVRGEGEVDLRLDQVPESSVDVYSRKGTIAGLVTLGALVVAAVVLLLAVDLDQKGYCGRATCTQ
jgi:hypothetical protein